MPTAEEITETDALTELRALFTETVGLLITSQEGFTSFMSSHTLHFLFVIRVWYKVYFDRMNVNQTRVFSFSPCFYLGRPTWNL